jgi:exopolysaccharide production protein ExoZ
VRTRATEKFGAIEFCRGVAATLVVVYHADRIVGQPRFYGAQPFGTHLSNFNAGVDFFFVLSGFIITWVHWSDIGNRSSILNFAFKRFIRIYPPYWGILFPLIILYQLFPAAGIPSQHEAGNIFTSILLLPNVSEPVLGVAWSLVHETFFYAIFAAILAIGRIGLVIMPIWAVAIIVAQFTGAPDFPVSFILNPFNLEFLFGVFAAVVVKKSKLPLPRTIATVGILGFFAVMLFAPNIQDNVLAGRLAFGLPITLFIIGMVTLEMRAPLHLHPAAKVFGAASYAIYLVHPIILSLSVRLISGSVSHYLASGLAAIILVLLSVAAGVLYWRFIERTLIGLFRRNLWPGAELPRRTR